MQHALNPRFREVCGRIVAEYFEDLDNTMPLEMWLVNRIADLEDAKERAGRLVAWLDAFQVLTEALPAQHEEPSNGCSTYRWHHRVIRDARAALDGAPLHREGRVYPTDANFPAIRASEAGR